MENHEVILDIPVEHERNLFGGLDCHVKKIERTLQVNVILRDGSVKILGSEAGVEEACRVFRELLQLSERGNIITEQNVDYMLSLAKEHSEISLAEIDREIIGYTIQGIPIKPKTLGQQKYVNQIMEKMMVFGIGPAGTGKTYLAMAMAIQAFKRDEVGKIILTRPAIEAGENLGFLPGDLQSKIDPYLRPLYDALYQISIFLEEKQPQSIIPSLLKVAIFLNSRSFSEIITIKTSDGEPILNCISKLAEIIK